MLFPSENMDFLKIENEEYKITVKWKHKYFEDYKKLSYDFYVCGFNTFNEVVYNANDNTKTDMWFLTGIFLIRHSIELGLKALLCRVCKKNRDIQDLFINCCHNLSLLYQKYLEINDEVFLNREEKEWLVNYLSSLEIVDEKSDMFRFPFEDDFLSKYRDKFLDIIAVANNLLQAFALVKKMIEKGNIEKEDEFDDELSPEFFVFATHGLGNCYLWQSPTDRGFYVKVNGYIPVIDYIYNHNDIDNKTKLYPMIFMFRNTIELCLKRLLFSNVEKGVPINVAFAKRKSHLIIKDLWKNVKPVIMYYAKEQSYDIEAINITEKQLKFISSIDKTGYNFRYPTSYSLEYRIDNIDLDFKNVYEYFKSIINFLDGCDSMLNAISDYQNEMRSYVDW